MRHWLNFHIHKIRLLVFIAVIRSSIRVVVHICILRDITSMTQCCDVRRWRKPAAGVRWVRGVSVAGTRRGRLFRHSLQAYPATTADVYRRRRRAAGRRKTSRTHLSAYGRQRPRSASDTGWSRRHTTDGNWRRSSGVQRTHSPSAVEGGRVANYLLPRISYNRRTVSRLVASACQPLSSVTDKTTKKY